MKKQYFDETASRIGCEWSILSPLISSVIAALIGAIVCYCMGISTEVLETSNAFIYAASAFTEICFLLVAILIAYKAKINFVSATQIKSNSPWWAYVGAVVISFLALILLTPIINCWQTFILGLGHADSSLAVNDVGTLFMFLVLLALLPAVCEEFLFRGVILNGLRKYGLVVSVGVSSLFFSLMHMNLLQLPYTLCLGIIFGIVVYYTKNIWLSIIMHFVNNATVLILAFIAGENADTFVWYEILIGVLGLALLAVGIYFLIKILNKKFPQDEREGFKKQQQNEQIFTETKFSIKPWIVAIVLGVGSILISILGGFNLL